MASPVVDKGSKSPNTPAQVDYKAKLDEAAEGRKNPPMPPTTSAMQKIRL